MNRKKKNKEIFKTEQFDEWKKSLTPSEADALKSFEYSKINELIKKVDGNIDFIKGDLYVNVGNTYKLLGVDGIREVIRNLDTALMKSKKIEKDIHVYRYLTKADVDFRIGKLSTSFHQSTINRDKYKLISKILNMDFIMTILTHT